MKLGCLGLGAVVVAICAVFLGCGKSHDPGPSIDTGDGGGADGDGDRDGGAGGDGDSDVDGDGDADVDGDSDVDGDGDSDGDRDDWCPGVQRHVLRLDEPVDGDTLDGEDDFDDPACASSAGNPDLAYALSLPSAGLVTVQVDVPDRNQDGLSDWDALLSVRADCEDSGSELACNDDYYPPDPGSVRGSRVEFCVDRPRSVAVVVDGYGSFGDEGGRFSLSASQQICDEGETCLPGLGCRRALAGGETCEDATVLPLDTTVAATTVDLGDDYEAEGCDFGDRAGDAVFAVTTERSGLLSVDLEGDEDFDVGVILRDDCADPDTERACETAFGTSACVGPGAHGVIVDGDRQGWRGNPEGSFTLRASFDACRDDEVCFAGDCFRGELEAEPNNDPTHAQAVAGGVLLGGEIARRGADEDWYALQLQAGQTVTVDLSEDCEIDTVAFLYAGTPDPAPDSLDCLDDERAVACDDDDGDFLCSYLTYTAPAAGLYTLRIVEWNSDSAGPYVMSIEVE